jgi:hypothetical protein
LLNKAPVVVIEEDVDHLVGLTRASYVDRQSVRMAEQVDVTSVVEQLLTDVLIFVVSSPVHSIHMGVISTSTNVGLVSNKIAHNFKTVLLGIASLSLDHVATEASAHKGRKLVLI